MAILIYVLIVVFSVTQVAATKIFNRQNEKNESLCFNALKCMSALILFFVYTLLTSGFELHIPTLIYGACYGLSLCISLYTGYRALCLGPMALTSMLVSFSIAIPLIWSVSRGNETVSPLQIVALAYLLVAMVTVNADKLRQKGNTPPSYTKWLFFVLLTFLTNGICYILQKEYSITYSAEHNGEFTVYSMLLCTVIYAAAVAVKVPFSGIRQIKGKRYAVISGTTNSIASFLTLALAGFENATVLFPVISAGTILASLACGRLLFKEKLKKNHYVAMVFGILAVVLLKI